MTPPSLKRPLRPPDWLDAHEGPVRADLTTARSAYELALGRVPPWAHRALALRNWIVARFGLKTPDMARGMAELPRVTETPQILEVGLEDRHLTFTIETTHLGATARVTTRIWYNHWTGRVYLALVLIPHKLIVRGALRRLA